MEVQKALYGSTALHRIYCNYCENWTLIIDGCTACCDKLIMQPDFEEMKRMSDVPSRCSDKRLPPKLKQRILREQEFRCIYCACYIKHNAVYDHFVPWAYGGPSKHGNIVASCRACNAVKSSKCFNSMSEARIYILNERNLL